MKPAIHALILLALLPLVHAAPPLGLTAHVDAQTGKLEARVETTSDAGAVYLVVTHEDPLAGTVVDRVVPLDMGAHAVADVSVDNLRPNVTFQARILDADIALPRLPGTDLLDLQNLPDVPSIVEVAAGLLQPLEIPQRLYAYPYFRSGGGFTHPGAVVSPDGTVSVLYLEGTPVMHFSKDGGHRFGFANALAPWNVTTLSPSDVGTPAFVVGLDGIVRVFTPHVDGQRGITGWTLANVVPRTQTISQQSYWGVNPATVGPYGDPAAYAVLPDGTGILATTHGTDAMDFAPVVRAFRPDGQVVRLPSPEDRPGRWAGGTLTLATSSTGAVFVGWWSYLEGFRYATSLDGGLSWTPARNASAVLSPDAAYVQPNVALDALGTAHAAFVVTHGTNRTLEYARFPVALPATAVSVNAGLPWDGTEAPYVSSASVAVAGPRVWLFADAAQSGDITRTTSGSTGTIYVRPRAVAWESVDGGAHFAPAHRFEVSGIDRLQLYGETALYPDGRPLILGRTGDQEVVVPSFDPSPEPECAQTGEPSFRTNPTEHPTTLAPDGSRCPKSFDYDRVPGEVTVSYFGATEPDGPLTLIPGGQAGAVAAVAGLGVGLLLASEGARYGWGLLLASLFARMRGPDVLRHTIREGIYDHVRENPGVRFVALRRSLGLSHGAAAYHLRVLEKNGLLRTRRVWTRRRFYPMAGGAPPTAAPAHDVVVDALRRRPGLGSAQLARDLGLSRQLVHYHLRRLEKTGRVLVTRAGANVTYSVSARSKP